MSARKVVIVLSTLVIAVAPALLTGCGGGGEATGASGSASVTAGATESRPLDVVLPDCSHSFRRQSKQLVPEMIKVALDSAEQRRMLWAGCFAGAPLRNLVWDPKIDFGELPDSVARNSRLADRFNQARALGLRKEFKKIIYDTPRKAPGSGQLEALELASQTPGVGRVVMFTDALVLEPEGIVLRTATKPEVEEAIARWAPRMRGLKGVELVFVGVGLGSLSAKSVRNAKTLFHGLAEEVGATFSWTRSLPLEF
jgi:hypothetical protein